MINIESHLKPTIATATELFECTLDLATISTIAICNTDGSNDEVYTIRLVPEGETRGDEHKIVNENTIESDNTKFITVGITPKVGTKVWVEGGGDTVFSIYGREGA